jgi:tRNA modification GTPase
MNRNWDDTIAALATPAGTGAIALIRISGPKAFEVLSELCPKAKPNERKSHSAFLSRVYGDKKEVLDEALVTLFKSPASFTGEDVVEIALHGSGYIVQETIKNCLKAGCRMAGPGEFTQRAFLNRKLDLAQAEAVGDLIAAESQASHRAALQQLKGGLSKEISKLRQDLIDFTALIELELDFSEEDVEFADRSRLTQLVSEIKSHIKRLMASFATGQAVKNGIPVVIVGPPNAGKSTLLNALLEEEKAIVSPVAGTTRDVIEDVIDLEGIRFRFVDTAGLRKTDDLVESIGISKTREQLSKAAFVLLLQAPDSDTREVYTIEQEIQERALPYLKIHSKSDLSSDNFSGFSISASTGSGMEELKTEIVRRSVNLEMLQAETSLITNLRHYEALDKTNLALNQVTTALELGLTGDLLATDIREALFHLGSITGEITVEDVLGSIFTRFCIGK